MQELTLSQEATHASPSVKPGSKQAKRMTVTSGRKCLESLSNRDQLGSFAKMLLTTCIWDSTKCLLTWKVRGTPQGRLLFRLELLNETMQGRGYGLLPTMSAQDPNWKNIPIVDKNGDTPSTVNERWYHKETGRVVQKGVSHAVCFLMKMPFTMQDRVNPCFWEAHMGYPIGWTDVKD